MNAIEFLEQQHEEVDGLFDEFEEASGADEKRRLVQQIIGDLRVHTTIEEEIFYPTVRERLSDVAEEIDEDLEEHHVVEMLLDELEGMEPSDARYDAKVEVLSELVEHHVEEEEEELFPEVADGLDDDELATLGERLQARAQELKGEAETSEMTKEQLYQKAQELGIEGRSQMSKRQLANAVRNAS